MTEVHVLLTKNERIVSVNASRDDADAKCERLNADPFIAPGESDPDAPYTVQTWRVQP